MNISLTDVQNPFHAPVFHIHHTDSTMNDARILALRGEPDGSAIWADFQHRGKGRIEGRTWVSPESENLLCTVLLRRAPVPGFTLRVGLAVAKALEAFLPGKKVNAKQSAIAIKWPNDVVYEGKKIAGILCENDGNVLYVGAGINLAQKIFPAELASRATSLSLIRDGFNTSPKESVLPLPSRETLLEAYLRCLESVLSTENGNQWREEVTERLYCRGKRIGFLSGDPDKNELLDGFIEGIGDGGELLFRLAENNGTPGTGEILHLWSGEIPYPLEPSLFKAIL